MEPKISVVIPVYNVEKYLPGCIESLLRQTMEQIEFIFVNDKSPDRSGQILDAYQEQDPERIRVIHLEKNVRQGGARNVGIQAARAKYIGFVDSDDYIAPDMYEILYQEVTDNDADVAYIYHTAVPEDADKDHMPSENNRIVWAPELRKLSGRELDDAARMEMMSHPIGGLWSGLWRKSMILENHIEFPEGLRYEDNYFGAVLNCYVNKACFVEQVKYFYRQNDLSTTNLRNQAFQYEDRIKIEHMLLEELKRRDLFERYKDVWENMYVCRYGINTCGFLTGNFDEIPRDVLFFVVKDVRKTFPKFYKNRFYRRRPLAQRLQDAIKIYTPRLFLLLRKLK